MEKIVGTMGVFQQTMALIGPSNSPYPMGWFGTMEFWMTFHSVGNDDPNWLIYIFQRGRLKPPTSFSTSSFAMFFFEQFWTPSWKYKCKAHQIPSNPIETCFEGTGQEQICHWSLWPATGAAAVLALLAAAMAAVCEESAAFSEGRTHGWREQMKPGRWRKSGKNRRTGWWFGTCSIFPYILGLS